MTRKELEALATHLGLGLATWSPGDGRTRYRVTERHGEDYFGARAPLFTGSRHDAQIFLYGVQTARELAQ